MSDLSPEINSIFDETFNELVHMYKRQANNVDAMSRISIALKLCTLINGYADLLLLQGIGSEEFVEHVMEKIDEEQ